MSELFRYDSDKLNRKQLIIAYGSDIENIEKEIQNLESVLNNKKYKKLMSRDKYTEVYSKLMDLKALKDLLLFEKDLSLI
jgi:hypothetical protein